MYLHAGWLKNLKNSRSGVALLTKCVVLFRIDGEIAS